MAKDLAVVLSSGSLNSLVTCALAAQKYRLLLVHLETDPVASAKGASRRRAAFDQQVAHFKPFREHVISLPHTGGVAGSRASSLAAATDPRGGSTLAGRLVELLPVVAAGVRVVEHYEAAALYLGLRIGGTHPGAAPGVTADELARATEYVQVWNEMLQLPCGMNEVEVIAPLVELDLWQTVDLGVQTAVPFDRSWSCIEAAAEPCGTCRGCRSREAAFRQAGKNDPMRKRT